MKTRSLTNKDGDKTAEVVLDNQDNFDYIGEFYVGNPPQVLRGCFDTGSANAWILSAECDTKKCEDSKFFTENDFFDPSVSSSYVDLDYWATIYFGSGKLMGHFGQDDFIVGVGEGEIHITQQTLGLMTQIDFLDSSYDAIIGLAYP